MVLHLRLSREQVAGTWKAENFIGAIAKGRPTAGTVDVTMLSRGASEPEPTIAMRHISHWQRRIFLLGTGALAGKGGARRGLRHDGRARSERC